MNNTDFLVLSIVFFLVGVLFNSVIKKIMMLMLLCCLLLPDCITAATPNESLRVLNGQLANPLPCSGPDGSGCANTPATTPALLPCSGPSGSGCANTPETMQPTYNPVNPYTPLRNMTPAFAPMQPMQYYAQPVFIAQPIMYQVPQPTVVWNTTPRSIQRPVQRTVPSPNLAKLFAHLDKYHPKPEQIAALTPVLTAVPTPVPTPAPIPTVTPASASHIATSRVATAATAVVIDVLPSQEQPIAHRSRIVAAVLGFALFFVLIPLFWQLYVRIVKIITIIKEDKNERQDHETG